MNPSVNRQVIKWTYNLLLLLIPLHSMSIGWDTDSDWEEYIQSVLQDEERETDAALLFEEFSYLHQNPINLNNTDKKELERLPFLTDIQIEKILAYIYLNYPMQTLYELQLVEELDRQTIRLLLPFVYIGTSSKDNSLKWNSKFGKSNLLLRSDILLSLKQGFSSSVKDSITIPPKYAGSPMYDLIKYEWGNSKFIKAGIVIEKDPGESFRLGPDFLSAHLQINDLGVIKRLVIGDYKVSFGQGLVINQGFALGKSYFTAGTNKRSSGITRSFSTDENRASRGAGITLRTGKGELSAWASFRSIDARVENDTILSLPTSGLHRTSSEINTRNQAHSWNTGAHYSLFINNLQLGTTAAIYGWDKPFFRELKYYNANYYRGNTNGQLSVDYQWHHPMISCFGETAISPARGIATLNGFTINPLKECALTVLHRYYGKRYDAYYAQAFANGSMINAENGIYLSLTLRPFSPLLLTTYVDVYQNLSNKYLINLPTNGVELFASALYTVNKQCDIGLKLRYKEGMKNASISDKNNKQVTQLKNSSVRLFSDITPHPNLRLKTTVAYTLHHHTPSTPSHGIGASQSIALRVNDHIFIDLSAAYIDTDDYFSSVSIDEKSILYTFSSNRYSGNLFRGATTLRYNINKVSIWIKYSASHYFDRDTISEGAESISTPLKHGIQTLIRLKF